MCIKSNSNINYHIKYRSEVISISGVVYSHRPVITNKLPAATVLDYGHDIYSVAGYSWLNQSKIFKF